MDQHIHAVIANAVLQCGKEAEVSLKAENVPGIDDLAAFDQRFSRSSTSANSRAASATSPLDGQMPDRDLAADSGQHACRGNGHELCLTRCRFQVAHHGKEARVARFVIARLVVAPAGHSSHAAPSKRLARVVASLRNRSPAGP